jgi:cytochrome c peroxidase
MLLLSRHWHLTVAALWGWVIVSLVGCHEANPAHSPPQVPEAQTAQSSAAEGRPGLFAEDATQEPAAKAEVSESAATQETKDHPEVELAVLQEGAASLDPTEFRLGPETPIQGIPGAGSVTVEEIKSWLANPENHRPLAPVLPKGLHKGQGQIKGLESNPLTLAKIELGRQLYFDTRLSKDNTVSCASCHHPDEGWSKHTQFGVGIAGQEGGRNSPVSANRILSDAQFWDGRAASLEEQAVGPIANPIEMGNTHEACVETLKGIEGYKLQFDKIFGELTIERVGQALAAFERAVVSGPSPFDYYEELIPFKDVDLETLQDDDPELYAQYTKLKAEADAHPMSESAIRGREIFFSNKGNCSACHVGPNLTDEQYYNIGVGMDKPEPDLGRYEVTKQEKDKGAFKTPTIRNVALSAPYMHDGSQKTLMEVVEWYNKGGHKNPYLSDRIKPLDLSEQDKKDLVAFMEACTGEFPQIETNRLPE